MKLSKGYLDKLVYEGLNGSRDVRWDSDVPGFGCRIYPSRKKSFVLSYRTKGRKRLLVIGQYGVITLDQARKSARLKLATLLLGTDPASEEISDQYTVKELCEDFLEKHSKVHKRSWVEDKKRINRYLLPQWGSRNISSISKTEVVSFHQLLGQNSVYQANRCVSLFGSMIERIKRWGVLDSNFANPTRGVEKFKEKSRERWLTHEELPRVASAIQKEQNVYAQAAIWLYLLTGARKSELLKLRWVDIDFVSKEMRLLNTKNGKDHYIPLSSAALSVISRIPKLNNNPYVICGNLPGRPLVNISKPWLRIRKMAHVEDVRLHDLRRTVGSWMAQQGNSLHLIGKVLNHSHTDTTKIYARLGTSQVRDALENYGIQLVEVAGVYKSKEIAD